MVQGWRRAEIVLGRPLCPTVLQDYGCEGADLREAFAVRDGKDY